MSDEQRLNSLDRFRKQPGRLVLEVYSHCEVPAGCGGAVLRWRNPLAAVPVRVHLYSPGKAVCFFDGSELRTAGADLAPGLHVIAIALEGIAQATQLLMVALISDDRAPERQSPEGVSEPLLAVLSRADQSWRYSVDPPATDDWRTLAFDDRAWPALEFVPTPRLGGGAPGEYLCRRAGEAGAHCLGLKDGAPASLWIRKVFEVPAPGRTV